MVDLVIVFLVIATIGMLAVVAWSALQNKMQPVKQNRAIVLRRRMIDYSIDGPTSSWAMLINGLGWGPGRPRVSNKDIARLSGEARIATIMNGLITFGVQGEEVELVVPESVYTSIEDGETGMLVYQGEIFKHFMPDIKVDEPSRPTYTPGRPLA